MAHTDKVMQSITAPGDLRCVDIVRTPNGDYGFCEYRRDPEDGTGWHPAGPPVKRGFASADDALGAARTAVPWLAVHLGDRT